MKRRICIVTGTRAEWGLLSNIAKALNECEDVELQIIATNMHLLPKFGNTYKEIEDAGFVIDYKVPMSSETDTPEGTVAAMSECQKGMSKAFEQLKPDLLIILGDRYEMLATASTALIYRIPIAHIAGGEVSEGAYDESIRHAITKMSHIHLTETAEARNRVIQLGENPEKVFNVGSIGVYNIVHDDYLSLEELEKELNTSITEKTLLVTLHPATLDTVPPEIQCKNMLSAFDKHSDYKTIITYPNNDTHGKVIISLIEEYAKAHPDRCVVFKSLGLRRYLSALRYVSAVVGNSSSGILEVPSMKIPTLNIGIRQLGRQAADSVVNCGVSVDEISKGLDTVLSPSFREKATHTVNPYEQPDTLSQIVEIVSTISLENITRKPFYDIK